MGKQKTFIGFPPNQKSLLDRIGSLREVIKKEEKVLKSFQKKLVSYIKKHRLQSVTFIGKEFLGNYEAKRGERISRTKLRAYLTEDRVEECTTRSKLYEWIKTERKSKIFKKR